MLTPPADPSGPAPTATSLAAEKLEQLQQLAWLTLLRLAQQFQLTQLALSATPANRWPINLAMLHLPPSEYRWLSPAVARFSPGGECGALPNAIGSSGPSSSMDNSGSAQTARGPTAEHSVAHKPRLNSGPLSPDTGGSAAAALGSAAGLPDRPGKTSDLW
ncbi:hypothetical protein SKAU_G00192780 [Synaphobranchus kaupii]|uniref:Uncharacterized protein n=1 Tax=Synaphobranchus kaupii TaxID=118154 RepID=A0A9Q1IWI7_SYNKA|nr:hypothetical protein SKAU_G00192780 [Synaphobranchus kaupii]